MMTLVAGQIQSFAPKCLFIQSNGQPHLDSNSKHWMRMREILQRSPFIILIDAMRASERSARLCRSRINCGDGVKSQTTQLAYCVYKSL